MTKENLAQQAKDGYADLLKEYIELLDKIGEGQNILTLDEITANLQKMLNEYGKLLTTLLVKALSEGFFESEDRKENTDLRVKQRGRTKRLYTAFGNIELPSDVYEHVNAAAGEEKRFCTPVLECLGVTPHQKTSEEIQRGLVAGALDVSYAKSAANVGDGTLSKQTVHDCVKRVGTLQQCILPPVLRAVEVLHIFLDEDHIALQKEKRKSTTMPVGAVAEGLYKEGRSPECEGRSRLLGRQVFVAEDLLSKTLLAEITAYIQTHYDLTVLKEIVVHGDGAGWINKAFDDDFPNVRHVFDGFHIQRELRHFAGRFTSTKKERNKLRRELEKALEAKDQTAFTEIVQRCAATQPTDPTIQKKCSEFQQFISRHWTAACNRFTKDVIVIGSCTESIVQHVLSSRLSSIPCSWSADCAAVIGTWRAARLNGVDVLHPTPLQKEGAGYTKIVRDAAAKLAAEPLNWDIFSPPPFIFDGNSATRHLLDMISHGGRKAG